jgi:hypothetical protein
MQSVSRLCVATEGGMTTPAGWRGLNFERSAAFPAGW